MTFSKSSAEIENEQDKNKGLNGHTMNQSDNNNHGTRPGSVIQIFLHPATRFLLCMLISASLLLLASRSSPLYPLNDWTDANTFFTLGKGMVRGRVLYRDLFDHKGPLLYFIYGLASLISYESFFGVYLLEITFLAIFLFLSLRMLDRFVDRRYSLMALPILAASLVNLRSFAYGGSAEFFSLPLIMAGLLYFTTYFKTRYPQSPELKWVFFQGFLAGCILWIKYSFLGFWLGWLIALGISVVAQKQYLPILKFLVVFLAGMLAATLPWLGYFAVTGAIKDWFQAYFLINLTAYSGPSGPSQILQTAIDSYQRHLQFNPLAIGLMTLGILLFTALKQFVKTWWFSLGLLLSIGMLALGVYASARDYIYYFLIFGPFIIFIFIHITQIFQQNHGPIQSKLVLILGFLIIFLFSIAYTFRFNRNIEFKNTQRENLVQVQFAEIINQSQNPTLLNYGFQDSGFYTAAGLIPEVKYYQKYNFDYGNFPINMDEQQRYIRDELVDFVVLRYMAGETAPDLSFLDFQANYQRRAKEVQFFGEQEFIYELFQHR